MHAHTLPKNSTTLLRTPKHSVDETRQQKLNKKQKQKKQKKRKNHEDKQKIRSPKKT